jgi:hypothetical protein
MMLGHPFFGGYDDDDYYHHHQPSYNQRRSVQRQRAAAEEARRRAEMDRVLRMKEIEEEERQRQKYLRRLQQKRREEEEYRHAYEAARLCRQQEVQRRNFEFEDEGEEEGNNRTEDDFRVVRGLDGNLYRVKIGEKPQPKCPRYASDLSESEPGFRLVQGPNGNLYRVKAGEKRQNQNQPSHHDDNENANPNKTMTPSLAEGVANEAETKVEFPVVGRRASKSGKKMSKKKVNIVVEDASDSESEKDFKSIWRNRHPSPGQLMEPINDA